MSGKRQSLDLDQEAPAAPATTTLEEQIERYQQHWSAVDYDRDDPAALQIRYSRRGPNAWWPLIPAGLCVLAAAAVLFVSPLATGLNIAILAALLAAALAFALAWRSCVNVRLGPTGLKAAAFPPFTGPSARVPLDNIRRFRVEKSGDQGNRRYTLNGLTRDGNELPLIRNIRIKDDAYLISMLLIDRVKGLR